MDTLKKNIIAHYKDQGRAWLKNLPKFLNNIEKDLKIKIDKPFGHLSFHYTAPAITQRGEQCVFKCGLPNKELATEIAALQHYNSQGAIQLLDANAKQGWLLLERCQPGQRLASIENDEKATRIAINVMQRLWKPIVTIAKFSTIDDWLTKLKPAKPIPNRLIDAAQQMSKDLLASQSEMVLLHGDLHHDNILSSQREPWLAIDPKGVIGEREYEIGALIRNPQTTILTKSLLNRRFDIISESTGFDRQRLLHWSIIQAVLAANWSIEDQTAEYNQFIVIAEQLYLL